MYNGQFDKQLNYIHDEDYRNWTKELLENVPDYFWTVAASSTGKYHPKYALGEGGLVRHTIAAVEIANNILNNTEILGKLTQPMKDCIIASLLLHDTFKHGIKGGKYTVHEHPMLAADYIRTCNDKLSDDDVYYKQHHFMRKSHLI